jgi:hypothetical protein
MELPFEDNSFDHVYVIEAACHAPDKVEHHTPLLSFCYDKYELENDIFFL